MMSYLEALILGVVQGLTEFLPVSSSGHLVLFETLMGVVDENLAFNISLHLGTLASILVFYYRDLIKVMEWPFIKRIIITSVPTAIIGLGMKKIYDFDHTDMRWVAVFFIITGFILYFSDKKLSGSENVVVNKKDVYMQISFKTALIIGVVQGFSVLPGISRSGATIATALLLGCTGPVSAFYSFIASVPAILGAALLELPKAEISVTELPLYISGALVAFFVGYVSLWSLKYYFIKRARLRLFSYYLWLLSAVIICRSLF